MTKKVLLLGGTGAMGVYVAPELTSRGYDVHITSRNDRASNDTKILFIKGDAHDTNFLKNILIKGKYDVVIDFMLYGTEEFKLRYKLLLKNCKQYIYLSSYRVFAQGNPITETSPRLLDVLTDKDYLATDEYALAKARQEDILRNSGNNNWTIIRPSITYSQERFQFGTVEADVVVWRALRNLPVTIPDTILDKQATMTWAGDAARLIAKLVLNKKAFGDDFNVSSSEHHSWSEIGDIYSKSINLKVKPVSTDDHVAAAGYPEVGYLMKYNRLYDRILDNSKVLKVVGETQADFMTLQDGLYFELSRFVKNPHFTGIDYAKQARIDRLTSTMHDIRTIPREQLKTYIKYRFPSAAPAVAVPYKLLRKTKSAARQGKHILHIIKNTTRVRTRFRQLRKSIRGKIKEISYKNPDGLVVTLDDYSNYGNIIQRFALQEFLRKNGYKFVSFDHNIPIENDLKSERLAKVVEFANTYIAKKDRDDAHKYPAYIVGSDQIWRNWNYKDIDKEFGFFFLNFVNDDSAKRIAYAASFGQDTAAEANLTKKIVKYLDPYLKKFTAISIREKKGLSILKDEWGIKGTQVLDPTMLLKARDYSKIVNKAPHKLDEIGDIFIYVIAETDEITHAINTTARSLNYSVSGIHLSQLAILPPIEYWFKGYRDAKLVITDSFHGTVFSIINNTPFIAVENSVSGAARIRNLLTLFGIESDRLVHKKDINRYDPKSIKDIDWIRVNKKLEELRSQSSDWLLAALK